MSSDPESFARLSVVKVNEHIDGLQAKVTRVCLANTIKELVDHYNVYVDSPFTRIWLFFRPKKKKLDFLSWVKAARQEYLDSGLFSSFDTPYWKSLDRCDFDNIINKLTRLAAHSDDYILVNDTDVLKLDNAIRKSKNVDKADEYINSLEKEYPGLCAIFKS